MDFMDKVPTVVPDVDFTWARHFLFEVYGVESQAMKELEADDPPATTFLHAVEYIRSGIGIKSYFLPRKLLQGGDPNTMESWDNAVKGLAPKNPSHEALMNFVANNPEGKLCKPV